MVTRQVWESHREQVRQNRLSERGKKMYPRRKETVERSFADAKQLHGHRYAKLRSLKKVREQVLLCAACQNMKKIALILGRSAKNGARFLQKTLFNFLQRLQPLTASFTSKPTPQLLPIHHPSR